MHFCLFFMFYYMHCTSNTMYTLTVFNVFYFASTAIYAAIFIEILFRLNISNSNVSTAYIHSILLHAHTHTHTSGIYGLNICLSKRKHRKRTKMREKEITIWCFFFLFYYFDGTKSDYTTRINYGLAFSFTSMEFFCFCASFRSYYVFDSNQKNTNLSVNYWIWSDQNS